MTPVLFFQSENRNRGVFLTLDPRLPFEDRVLLALLVRMSIEAQGAAYRERALKALAAARLIAMGRT